MVTAEDRSKSKFAELDPLRISAELPLTAELYPLGFPLRLATNSRDVLEAAAEVWTSPGRYQDGEAPLPDGHGPAGALRAFAVPAIEMRVLVEPGDEPLRPPVFRAQGHLITISAGAENFAVCDHTRHFTYCRLSATAAADRDFARYYFLEAMALFTLTQLYVTPIHAAAIARDGRALLLAGDSGAGKSTLAYACARRGWTYISDNESWLLRSDARTVLGNPARIRLRDTAVSLFPEVGGKPAVIFNGKRSIVLETGCMEVARQCRPGRIVFLERTGETAAVERMAPEEAFARLFAGVIRYTAEVREEHRASLAAFAGIPAYRLRYRGLEDAIPALERMLA